jgi:hypothetical protein
VARKSTLEESTILRRSFGGCELASIFRVEFSFANGMYYMPFAMGLDNFVEICRNIGRKVEFRPKSPS